MHPNRVQLQLEAAQKHQGAVIAFVECVYVYIEFYVLEMLHLAANWI